MVRAQAFDGLLMRCLLKRLHLVAHVILYILIYVYIRLMQILYLQYIYMHTHVLDT